MPDKGTIAARLREVRGKVPRATVAKACGIRVSTYGMYEQGQRMPSDAVKVKLSDFFGIGVEKLFFTD